MAVPEKRIAYSLDGEGQWSRRRGSRVDEGDRGGAGCGEVTGGDSHGEMGCVNDGGGAVVAVPESSNAGHKVCSCKGKEGVAGAVSDVGEGA